MATSALSTTTAADFLTFETFHDVAQNVDRITRVATASQEFVVKDWDNEQYVIRFDKNFSKKHLFTFSKKEANTKATAQQNAIANPGASDAQNWHDAEIALMENKIASNLSKRAVADMCRCGHNFKQHQNKVGANYVMVPCKQCVHPAPACAQFETPYGLARRTAGKPTHNPLSGATTTRNTCIILNWVPKDEFESVIAKSIQAYEKPHGWAKGQPLAVAVNEEKLLKWDFALGRRGAILLANGVPPAPTTFTNFQGCYVHAKKTATDVGKQTWEVFHMESKAPNGPF